MIGKHSLEHDTEVFVLDFTDASWLASCERRRHFIGTYGGRLWKFKRAAQGSRNGPLSLAGLSSLLLRCTQSVFTGMSSDTKHPTARAQHYVDDPAIAISGTQESKDDIVATAVLIWSIMGFWLTFHNAQRGTTIVWIGAHIDFARDRVVISIPEPKLTHFFASVEDTLKLNVVGIRSVRTLARKANHFASILYVWRPFLSELWGALGDAENPKSQNQAPPGCIWVKQIRLALLWFQAFLRAAPT